MLKNRSLIPILLLSFLLYFHGCRSELFAEGERIYKAYCSNCHMDDGTGLGTLIPPLTDKKYLNDNMEMLPCIILNGQQGEIIVGGKKYDGIMPSAKLTDIQILNLVNYITNSWGNKMGYTTITDIQKWKANCTQ